MGENQVKKLSLLVESNLKQLLQKSWGKKLDLEPLPPPETIWLLLPTDLQSRTLGVRQILFI